LEHFKQAARTHKASQTYGKLRILPEEMTLIKNVRRSVASTGKPSLKRILFVGGVQLIIRRDISPRRSGQRESAGQMSSSPVGKSHKKISNRPFRHAIKLRIG
jgi:hypothetical protein